MDQWAAHIAASVGIDPSVARIAVGHVFGFLHKRYPDGPADELFDKIPGARDAIAEAEAAPRKRSLFGSVLGGVGGMFGGSRGDMLELTSRLTGLGLSSDQLKRLAHEIFGGVELVIGREKLQAMTDPIPGLSKFLWPKG